MRKTAFFGLIIFIFLFSYACGESVKNNEVPPQTDSVSVFPADDSIPEDLIIRLQRTPCFGTCPAYMMTVNAKGEVNFFGQDHVEAKGQNKGRIGEEKIRQLIGEFKQADFFNLADNYTSKNCLTDNPTVRTTLLINGKTKKIEHDRGCEAPPGLTGLEDKIDEIVGTQKWIGDKK